MVMISMMIMAFPGVAQESTGYDVDLDIMYAHGVGTVVYQGGEYVIMTNSGHAYHPTVMADNFKLDGSKVFFGSF